jgi:hypothetical protein
MSNLKAIHDSTVKRPKLIHEIYIGGRLINSLLRNTDIPLCGGNACMIQKFVFLSIIIHVLYLFFLAMITSLNSKGFFIKIRVL